MSQSLVQSRDHLAAIAHSIAIASPSPHHSISAAYQRLCALQPIADESTGLFCLVSNRARLKSEGVYYTPRTVARLVVDASLAAQPRPSTVFDPSMGTGVFLLEAALALSAREGDDLARIVEQRIAGVDNDPMAVDLAILSLWLETGARPEILRYRLRSGDILTKPELVSERPDAVLGNPPWGSLMAATTMDRLAERFPQLSGSRRDSFAYFLAAGAEATRGTLGMVVPQAVLAQTRYAGLRSLLLERLAPATAIQLGNDVFPGATAPACALVFGQRPGPPNVCYLDLRSKDASLVSAGQSTLPGSSWNSGGFSTAPLETIELLARLQTQYPTLEQLQHLFRIRDSGINYNRRAIAQRSLYTASEPDDARDLPRYRGRDFARYSAVTRSGWLRHDVIQQLDVGEHLSLDWSLHELPQKLVLRQTADRLTVTIDPGGMVMGRSVIAITSPRADLLAPLLACLNSHLLTVLYRLLAGEEGRILPQVKVARLRVLPIPFNEDGWSELGELARIMLARQGLDRDLDAEIDRSVFRLYGLSGAEMRLL